MSKTRRRLVVIAALLAVLTSVGAWMYWQSCRLARWVPGRYTATNLTGDQRTHFVRFSPDGSCFWKVDQRVEADELRALTGQAVSPTIHQ